MEDPKPLRVSDMVVGYGNLDFHVDEDKELCLLTTDVKGHPNDAYLTESDVETLIEELKACLIKMKK